MMKKLILINALIFGIIANLYAGAGSTMDFLTTAQMGYDYGCDLEATEDLDNFRKTACSVGSSLKKSGISEKDFSKVIENLLYDMPKYDSVCN